MLTPLVGTNAIFPCLKSFTIQQAKPSDHNRSIVGASYDENGVLARLLRQSPTLQHLTVPSAPNADFFEVGTRPIQFLSVDAGYDTQRFIANLSESRSFPDLRCLEWGEYNETYMENWQANSTPFSDYERLFRSMAFLGVNRFVWRNPVCSKENIQELKGDRPGLQMLIVRFASEYA